MNMIFVCSGNTCRSPMAAKIAAELSKELCPAMEGKFDSAGIATCDGLPASDHSIEALAEWGWDLSDHRSKALQYYMVAYYDRVVCMTEMHKNALVQAFPEAAEKITVIGELSGTGRDIPDPYGGSLKQYEHTRDVLKEEITLILKKYGK